MSKWRNASARIGAEQHGIARQRSAARHDKIIQNICSKIKRGDCAWLCLVVFGLQNFADWGMREAPASKIGRFAT